MTEHDIQARILLDLGQRPEVLIVRRNVGKYLAVSGSPVVATSILREAGIAARVVAIGQAGEADLQGIVGGQTCPSCSAPIHPRPFAIEVKTATGRLRPDQLSWAQNVWQRRGGSYTVARSVDDARVILKGAP